MKKAQQLFVVFLFSISSLTLLLTGNHCVVADSSHHHRHRQKHGGAYGGFRPTKLFVFGDSYGDTGNSRKSISNSWKDPYGLSFPGKPTGRFSDGRVFTDYLAKFLGMKSPIPYTWRKFAPKRLRYGINFAYGGTGVFDTMFLGPNMTTQLNFFQDIANGSVYTKWDLNSSLALVTLAGNDYGYYFSKGGSFQDLPTFISLVVNQLITNLKHIHGLGVKKVAVTSLQPLGCLPRSTAANSFQKCNSNENSAVSIHNRLLHEAVAKMNNESKDSTYIILDLYDSFVVGLISEGLKLGQSETPLKPCCVGISSAYSCGSLDENGAKMYTVCSSPESAFFWDMAHPTQAGWLAVYSALKPTLEQNIFTN